MEIIGEMAKRCYLRQLTGLFIFIMISSCGQISDPEADVQDSHTWAEKLGFPAGKRVLIFHADDMGMADEANEATVYLMENGLIQSAAAMPPCPAFEDAIKWAVANPGFDVGIHLTLTSEWRTHRWGPVSDPSDVPGLVDPDGYMWRSVRDVVLNGTPAEVEKELRAQIEKTLAMGYRPDHMDTHMGTVFGSNDFTEIYFRLAEEYNIPAMIVDYSNPAVLERYKQSGYPITERLMEMIDNYSLPMLDTCEGVFQEDELIFTNWQEIMERF
jgi:chitin disaccharide deacetylase